MTDMRPAQPEDAPELAEIFRAGFESFREWAPEGWQPPSDLEGPEDFERALSNPDVWGRVIPGPERIAAYVTVKQAADRGGSGEPIPDLGQLWMLFVRREHWGQGLARRLLVAGVDELVARGFPEARLHTPAGNRRSCALYERNGWRAVASAEEPELGLRVVEYRLALR
jgi:ribosomal protein S18 acetylase RimI-like enzyme